MVEKILSVTVDGIHEEEAKVDDTVVAPSRALAPGVDKKLKGAAVEILATLPGRRNALNDEAKEKPDFNSEAGDIVAVRQGNVFGTSFHPELTGDPRIHIWWLERVVEAVEATRGR